MDWRPHYFYAFPPFSVIANCLQKIEQDQSTGLLLVPLWTTQPWFTLLLKLLVDHPLILPQLDSLLFQPHSKAVHSLSKRLHLMACKVSGNPSSNELFRAKLPTSSCSPGQLVLRNNMRLISQSGMTCSKQKVNSYNPPLNAVLDFLVSLQWPEIADILRRTLEFYGFVWL